MGLAAVATIAASAVSLLAPYLKKAGEKVADEMAGAAWTKIRQLYQAIKSKLSGRAGHAMALGQMEEKPADAQAQAAARAALEEALRADEDFARRVAQLLKEADEAGADAVFHTAIHGDVQRLVEIGAVHGDVTVNLGDEAGARADAPAEAGKVASIGVVQGNVILVSDDAVRRAVGRDEVTDVTDYIHVTVRSNRFGKRVRVRVSQDMIVAAFVQLLVGVLSLPPGVSCPQIMLYLEFEYSVAYKEQRLAPDGTLRKAGIVEGDEVGLFITVQLSDAAQPSGPAVQVAEELGPPSEVQLGPQLAVEFRPQPRAKLGPRPAVGRRPPLVQDRPETAVRGPEWAVELGKALPGRAGQRVNLDALVDACFAHVDALGGDQ